MAGSTEHCPFNEKSNSQAGPLRSSVPESCSRAVNIVALNRASTGESAVALIVSVVGLAMSDTTTGESTTRRNGGSPEGVETRTLISIVHLVGWPDSVVGCSGVVVDEAEVLLDGEHEAVATRRPTTAAIRTFARRPGINAQ